jgi:hypothetical protein
MKEFSLLLLASSFIFITNVLSTFYKKYYIYSFLFFCLTLTSILVHYSNDIYAKIVDKFFIFTIVLYGGYLVCKKTTIEGNPGSLSNPPENLLFSTVINLIPFMLMRFMFLE